MSSWNIRYSTTPTADAHCLPFRDAAFDAVVTFNTFEHLYDPGQAAREIYRVLKPGGRLFLHGFPAAPVHERPHHYYNATEYGVRQWFKMFDVKDVSVSSNFQPGFVLAWLSCEILAAVKHHVGPEAHRAARRKFSGDLGAVLVGSDAARPGVGRAAFAAAGRAGPLRCGFPVGRGETAERFDG